MSILNLIALYSFNLICLYSLKNPLSEAYPRLALQGLLLRIFCHTSPLCTARTACNGRQKHTPEAPSSQALIILIPWIDQVPEVK